MKTKRNSTRSHFVPAALTATLSLVCSAEAGSRRFTDSYETTTMAKGAMELESWVTWKTEKQSDPDFERFDIRHEFEYGYSDRLQLAFYFADWRYEENATEDGKADFRDVALEVIYNLTDPNTTPFGTALYGEIKGGDEFIELEGKFLLQKNVGQWMFVYNIGGAIEWEDNYESDEAELMQSAGVSYQINPSWSLGAEVLHEIAVPDVDTIGDSAVYLGPNLSWRHENFSAALTGMWQPPHPRGRGGRLPGELVRSGICRPAGEPGTGSCLESSGFPSGARICRPSGEVREMPSFREPRGLLPRGTHLRHHADHGEEIQTRRGGFTGGA